jgi:hypothetical protein
MPVVGPVKSSLCLSGWLGRGDGMILSTLPGNSGTGLFWSSRSI